MTAAKPVRVASRAPVVMTAHKAPKPDAACVTNDRTRNANRSMNPAKPELVTSPSNATHAAANARSPPVMAAHTGTNRAPRDLIH